METCFFLTGGFNQWAKKAFENWHGCVLNPLLIYHFHGKAARFFRSIHSFCNYIYPRVSLILGHQEAEHSGGKHVWINCSFSFGDMDTKKHSRCCFKKNIKIKSKLSTNHQSKSWCFTLIAYQQENKCLATMAMSLYVLGLFRRSIWKLLPNTLAMFFFEITIII